jgi:hypothetical protein
VEAPEEAVAYLVRRSRGMTHAYLKRVLVSTALRLQTTGERGDAAFHRLLHEEVADALADRQVAYRSEKVSGNGAEPAGFGFRVEEE